ncbi:MAG TPA: gamma-glutamyltransferase family protein [Rhizomicrobium sp.]|nr:gamma-glutamyltransferase family protein [Rhizomicrobium sp.]
MNSQGKLLLLALGFTISAASLALSQQLATSTCNSGAANPPACKAVRGDRADGWMAQSRSEVVGRNGMVATSQPLAAQAGLEMLRRGGNAVDAAVAAAAVLNLTEPMNVGMGGDLFAIIYTAKDHKLHVLNASGKAASGQSVEFMNAHGYRADPANWGPGSGMPQRGILSATVPGAAWGWQEVLDKYGSMTFKQVLEPAATYASQGVPVAERAAFDWRLPRAVNAVASDVSHCCTAQDPDSIHAWYINGQQPKAGQIFRNPDLAKAFRLLQAQGRDAFYKGDIAKAIVAKEKALGGTMTLQDLADYKGEWVEPVTSDYHGFTLAELPPPSQGFAANEMLNILATCIGTVYPGQTLASLGPTDPRYWHMLVEAKKLAYADMIAINGDPDFNPGLGGKVKALLTHEHAQSLCGRINPGMASATRPGAGSGAGDTIVLAAADRWGNMVSWVNSNFSGFGSGVTVPGYGFVLHNRGGLFSLDPKSPNAIAPHKRPFNTLAAAFLLQGGRTDGQLMAFQLMGGDMQAQGHAQMVVNMVDLGANLQASTDMARFHHSQIGNVLGLESQLAELVGDKLKAMGHTVRAVDGGDMGGFQAILFTPDPNEPAPDPAKTSKRPVNGTYRAGTDHRKDGLTAAW